MPWCPQCDRFLSPPTVCEDGTCPTCGRPVEMSRDLSRSQAGQAGQAGQVEVEEEETGPVPFHIKALGAALAIYLGWRFVQGVEWVVQHL